jgi:hypothetical protein
MRDWVQPGKGGPHFYLSIHFEAGDLRQRVAALGMPGFEAKRLEGRDRFQHHWVTVDVLDATLELESHYCEQGDPALPLLAQLLSSLTVRGWHAFAGGDNYDPVEAGQGDHAALCRYLDLPVPP